MFAMLKLKHKIFAGFISVGLVATVIAVLSYGAINFVSTNFKSFVNSSNKAQLGLLLAHDISEIQRQALIYTHEAHENAAKQVHALNRKISDTLEKSSEHDPEYIRKILKHLKSYMSAFDQLQQQKQLQHSLVYNDIRASASNVENHLRAYIKLISVQKIYKALLQDERILNTLLQVEKNAMRYFESLDPLYIAEAKVGLAKVRTSLQKIEISDTSKTALEHIQPAIQEIIEFERVFLEAVARTRGYLFLVNVVMSAETYEILYNARQMSAQISQDMAEIEQATFSMLQQIISAIVATIVISLLLVVLLSLLIERSITNPIVSLTKAFNALSKGSHQADIPVYKIDDEIGHLTSAANIFKEKNRQTEELLDQAKELTEALAENKKELEKDINDLKTAEETLKKWQNIFLNAGWGVVAGLDTLEVMNLEFAHMHGYEIDELVGQPISMVYSPRSRKLLPDILKRVNKEGKLTFQSEHIRKDGSTFPVEINATAVMDDEGIVLYRAVNVLDITERTRLQAMMMQTEKMLSIGGLAAGMAHEINNPLSAILQGVQNVRRRLSKDLKGNLMKAEELGLDFDKMHDYLVQRQVLKIFDVIFESGERASAIIVNMLGFARQAGADIAYIDLRELMDETLNLAAMDYDLKKKFDFKGIMQQCEYTSDMPLVFCVRAEIQQVILNLLTNAAHAFQAGKTKIDNPKITLRIAQDGGMALIEVADNGPGMSEDVRSRVFEPFFTTKPPGKGTGLGLSVAYYIICDEHRGRMEVVSEPGQGATFKIWLPLEQEQDQ